MAAPRRRCAARRRTVGWANEFKAPATGEGTLRFETSPLRYLVVAVQALVWLAAAAFLWRTRRRREEPLLPEAEPHYEPLSEGVPA